MAQPGDPDAVVLAFAQAVALDDEAQALRLLDADPELARRVVGGGATRQAAAAHFLPALGCYLYAGDTSLHVAAAAWRPALLRRLIACGADAMARNRLGATPLHYAASGNPDASRRNPTAQVEAIEALAKAGADPNVRDNNGSTPLHRAIRTRCAAATDALLRQGADPGLRTKNGSTAERLARVTSGRGGSGSPAAKEQQARILARLESANVGAPAP